MTSLSSQNIVERKDFDRELERIKDIRVSYIVSPGGWGKSTSVKKYLSEYSDYDEIYWYSLGSFDNQNSSITDYDVTIIDNSDVNNPKEISTTFATLISRISNTKRKILLIFDDFHLITNINIKEAISSVIRSSGNKTKYIIISRNEVPVEMGTLLAMHQLEIVSTDKLRFTKKEIAEYYKLNDISIDEQMVEKISSATNGWPAAINVILLAFKLNGNSMTPETFTLADNYISKYFAEEVFSKFPSEVQDILVKISVLNKIDIGLAETLTGLSKEKVLDAIKYISTFTIKTSDNMFICHDILLNFLREQLKNYPPEDVKKYYKIAADWYSDNKELLLAAQNYYHAEEYPLATDMLERIAQTNITHNSYYELEHVFRTLPVKYRKSSVVLSAFMIRLEIANGNFDDAESWYNNLISLRHNYAVGTVERGYLEGQISYALLALPRIGCNEILKIFPKIIKDIKTGLYESNYVTITNNNPSILRGVKDLSQYGKSYREMGIFLKPLVTNIYKTAGYGAVSIGSGELYYYLNRLNDSIFNLSAGLAETEQADCPETRFVAYGLLAKASLLAMKKDDCQQYLDTCKKYIESTNSYNLLPNYRALCVDLSIISNDSGYVEYWLDKYAPSDSETYKLLFLYQFIIKAKVYLYLNEYDKALLLTHSLLGKLDRMNRPMDKAECLIIQAIACFNMDNSKKAFEILEEALLLTQKYNYIRLFSDYGFPVFSMLTAYWKQCVNTEVSEKFVKDIITSAKNMSVLYPNIYSEKNTPQVADVDLSNTELKILHLLDKGKSNAEIAAEIDVKIPTVKYHLKNLFTKLDAKNRTSALSNAKSLKLLD